MTFDTDEFLNATDDDLFDQFEIDLSDRRLIGGRTFLTEVGMHGLDPIYTDCFGAEPMTVSS